MNAAVIVSNVVNRKKTWHEALEVLEGFWMDEGQGLSSTPDFSKWWWPDKKANLPHVISASKEALTKYYSVKEYMKHEIPNVSWPQLPKYDLKFGDPENT